MNTVRILCVCCAMVLFGRPNAVGQAYQLTFSGTCYETNSAGKITSTPITEKTWLQDTVHYVGLSNADSLTIVYYEKPDTMGDAIHVMNTTSGEIWTEVFGFYFGESYGRLALKGATGERRIDYVYTHQNTRSLGWALISKDVVSDGAGGTRKIIKGQMHYLITPDANNPNLKLCTGTFVAAQK